MINLTARIGGSKLRSIGFIMMKTCWFLCVSPDSSLRAALQKYWTQPCFPKKVEGRPKGRPNLKGKLWMPPDNSTGSPPGTKKKIKHIIKINLFKIFFWPIVICTKVVYMWYWIKNSSRELSIPSCLTFSREKKNILYKKLTESMEIYRSLLYLSVDLKKIIST